MTRRLTALTLAALAIATLAGCTPTPEPTETPSASATPTPTPTATPTAGAAPQQEPVPAPTSEEEAVLAADRAYQAYLPVDFELKKNPELGVDYVSGYVVPESRFAQILEDTVEAAVKSKGSVTGEPFSWQSNLAMSYAAPLTNNATGEDLEFGGVTLYGCADSTKTVFLEDGEPVEGAQGLFPARISLIYASDAEAWKITDQAALVDSEGNPLESQVPQC
ncbi:hypothetical protein [Microbacterium sediminis]|uniref:hypothetical protein n=1 Tax=Microbacterium sediminis TaxID=904291 RepID=UPI001071D985|nr:hypothetical protein [Microbacterium sediminis]QBR75614.1 hypothetical protein E3O41_13635 [Microbacterium sediminis]